MKKFILFCFLILIPFSTASAAVGYIDTSFSSNTAKVCHDVTCTTPVPGVINFALDQEPSIIINPTTGISGSIWSNTLGWITMDPEGAGVYFVDAATGVLGGKAWSQVAGWINFAPTGQQVRINPSNGRFEGWAWSGGPYGGWIKFDCTDEDACVHTTWRNTHSSGGGGSSGGTIRPVVYTNDSCSNIEGAQSAPPEGMIRDESGVCIPIAIDFCPNIPGAQTSIPSNMTLASSGFCIVNIPKKDFCPNDKGIQTSYTDCTKKQEIVDACLNIPDIQKNVPKGYEQIESSCYPSSIDFCSNIEGSQSSIPAGLTIDPTGACILSATDACLNIPDIQDEVPPGYEKEGSNCSPSVIPQNTQVSASENKKEVVAFSFIPKDVQIPVDTPFVIKIVNAVDKILGTKREGQYVVDGISVATGVGGGLLLIGIIVWIVRRIVRPV